MLDSPHEMDRRAARVRTLTRILDSSIRVPGTGWTLGLDPILGLLPWAGDVAGAVLSGWLIWQSARLGAGPAVVARMLLNVAVETVVGVVPVIGDVFDATWKANTRNLALLERHLADPGRARAVSRGFWIGVGLSLAGTMLAMTLLSLWLLLWLLRAVGLI